MDDLRHSVSDRPVEVSVVLTTYNRPQLLSEALASLEGQVDVKFEVVVVNDAGCDVSDVIANFNNSLRLRHVKLERNVGLPAARNVGFAAARGCYIAYLDDDDLYLPGHLGRLAARLDISPEVGLVYSDALLSLQKREASGRSTLSKRVLAHDYDHATMLHDSFIPPSSMMHRRECFDRVGGFDESLRWCYDDWDFLLRIGMHYTIERVAGISVSIRLRDDGSNLSCTSRPERELAADYLQRQYGAAKIFPKTFWEVAETLSRPGG